MSDLNRWEYRSMLIGTSWSPIKDEEMEGILNEWGEEGWEVFAVVPMPSGMKMRVIAKRPLTVGARQRRSMPAMDG